MKTFLHLIIAIFFITYLSAQVKTPSRDTFKINQQEYLEMRGANVMLAHDFYPESHQGGVGLIQNGLRVATNGDLRLEPTPGQWQPVPKVGERKVDLQNQIISVRMSYPDSSKNGMGFNPIVYPDLSMSYTLKVQPQGASFKIIVDLDQPLPAKWIGKVGMNIELFPGILFGKSYYIGDSFGIFPRQANGPGFVDESGEFNLQPLGTGKKLTISPEDEKQTLVIENLQNEELQLLDGRAQHSNGWFIVRSLVPAGKTKNAIEWLITPNVIENYTYEPVLQVSQVGYHPAQEKIAVLETDRNDNAIKPVKLLRIKNDGGFEEVKSELPKFWGQFLRYNYYHFDFSNIKEPGMYVVNYDDNSSRPFQINNEVYGRHVWQPTLEYFLPVQMCHMRVNDRYKVWHGRCHLDDARMAPINTNHFDGYLQGPETLTKYTSGQHVPGINVGGWHDAGDYDLRVESQASTIKGLSHIYELFKENYDNTLIDQTNKIVEMHTPDGKEDILQQIEHGALSIVGGYEAMGRFYRGIIVPHKRQYILLGDAINHSDNQIYGQQDALMETDIKKIEQGLQGAPDDRWVFTEDNPRREINTAAALAATSVALKDFNKDLSKKCLDISKTIWTKTRTENPGSLIELAVELLKATNNSEYSEFLLDNVDEITSKIQNYGWLVGPVLTKISDLKFQDKITEAVRTYRAEIDQLEKETPYGLVYKPDIWGAGWGIQSFGVKQFYWHTSYPTIFPKKYMLNALNFILGVHPGVNTASFASGVGSKSLTQAYGINRGEFSFIPGGVGSGTALIRPDFPELLEWPFLWQQTEYVLGGGTTDYIFLVLAAHHLLNE